MTKLRVGIGFDQHAFANGPERDMPLVLGGVRFEAEQGLKGHSDADVVAHAVADAMLGAAGLGDLGAHFPDTDQRWAGADSLAILAQVAALIMSTGLRLANADCTVICEIPRIGDGREIMMERLSAVARQAIPSTRPRLPSPSGRVAFTCTGPAAAALLEEIGL